LIIGALIGVVVVALKMPLPNGQQVCSMQLKQSLLNSPTSIGQWFQDSIQPIIDKAKELIKPVIDASFWFHN
jgi:hypothetical protein